MPIYIYFALLILLSQSCSDSSDTQEPEPPVKDHLEIVLHASSIKQTIRHFGASDAWSCQFVGANWPGEKKTQIADWLFSTEFDTQGNPKGIGLNSWRFNLGAGSAAQGGSSGIDDEWRRAESFLTANGYDWEAHKGQRWFLQAAKERGVDHFTAFSNSPPVTMTKNGKAFSSGGQSANLSDENYSAYANFLVEVLDQSPNRFGVSFDELSPFNEPQWDWKGGQEGSPWLNEEIAEVTRIIDAKIQEKGLQTKIDLVDAGKLNYLYENADKPGRADQINAFFQTGSADYVGNLPSVRNGISGHSYYTTFGTSALIDVRKKLNERIRMQSPDFEFAMSEYCLLENNEEMIGNGRDLGIDPALYLARVIYADLVVANASVWQWWLAVSPYDYKDGLIYIDNKKDDGNIYESKLLWALGNYSFFIKEGFQRIDISRSDRQSVEQSINGLLVSAYRSVNGSKMVAVIVNQRDLTIPLNFKIDGKTSFKGKKYITSGQREDNLAYRGEVQQEEIIDVPARSIVTVVFE